MSHLAIEPNRTALVLIDFQHLNVNRPLVPLSGAEIVANGARLASAVRESGGTVVYVRVLVGEIFRPPVDVERPRFSELPPDACDIVPEAGRQEGDLLVTKRQWCAFYATELDQHLRRRNVKTILLGGIATNFGVESTARGALDRDYEVVFASDAMSSLNAEMHDFSITRVFPMIGRVRTTDEIIEALK
ncbi:MAG: isochorismatase family protein [Armatimonadetes bacterium]|nr:isochorismatase family protein [Armatimonadota bacterium]